MRKPVISMKVSARMYAALVNLGNRVITSLTGNLSFATPDPALMALQTAVTAVENAISVWGPISNRGSHADLVDLQTKARVLANMLKSESQYVQLTAQAAAGIDYATMGAIITTSGFELASLPGPQGRLEMVQNFRQFVSRKLSRNEIKLKWKRPLNVTSKNNVKNYRVLRNTTADFTTAVEIALVTKGTYTDTNTTAATVVWTYWVVPYNTEGAGVESNPITVAVLSA
jgi:hypothetical protein